MTAQEGMVHISGENLYMLSPFGQIANLIRQQRRSLGLSQRQVARLMGCSQPYLAQVETCRRPVSRKMAERLEKLFEVEAGTYTQATFTRGRPPLTEVARLALRDLRKACGPSPQCIMERGRKPRFPRPDWAKAREDALGQLGIHLGDKTAEEVRKLEGIRLGDERFWRNVNSIRYDSLKEKELIVKVGLRCSQLTGVSLAVSGCGMAGANGITGRDTVHRAFPAFILRHEATSILWFPQRCLRTPSGYRWPDNLLVIARNGQKVSAAVEVDGPEFHQDEQKERQRDRDLGVPVLHVEASEINKEDILEKILEWATSLPLAS